MKKLLLLLLFLLTPIFAYAQGAGQTIPQLPWATFPLSGNELVPCWQNVATFKCTVRSLNLNGGGGSSGITQLTRDVLAGPGTGSTASLVVGLQGNPICAGVPSTNQLIGWNGSCWVPVNPPVSGINQLTGAVTAGPGTGSQSTTITPTGVSAGSYTLGSYCVTLLISGQISNITSGSCAGAFAFLGTGTSSTDGLGTGTSSSDVLGVD